MMVGGLSTMLVVGWMLIECMPVCIFCCLVVGVFITSWRLCDECVWFGCWLGWLSRGLLLVVDGWLVGGWWLFVVCW